VCRLHCVGCTVSAALGREVIIPAGPVWPVGMKGTSTPAADVDRLLTRLTRFLLRHSAEGAFELRDTVRQAAAAFGARADVLALAEGAVLEVNHADGSQYGATLRVLPELTRLDLVAEAKLLQARSSAADSRPEPHMTGSTRSSAAPVPIGRSCASPA
jgi:hypothetical protein